MSIKALDDDIKAQITPFFDYARKDGMTEDSFKKGVLRLERSVSKNLKDISAFYLDNYDINTQMKVDGEDNYKFLMEAFISHNFIPVVGLDRNDTHIKAITNLKNSGELISDTLAIRLNPEDFESFTVTDIDIEDELSEVLDEFEDVDLLLDCRVCTNLDASNTGKKIATFVNQFSKKYQTRRVVIAGSSITPSIGDMLNVKQYGLFVRNELHIFEEAKKGIDAKLNLYLGDFGIVSPNYSDVTIPGYVLPNVMTPKIIYSFDGKHYVIRGGALKTDPRGNLQYNDFSKIIVKEPFYRGKGFSFGDGFLEEKSRGVGNSVTPGSILKPTINAHIAYMYKNY